jgi:hypothetical protein
MRDGRKLACIAPDINIESAMFFGTDSSLQETSQTDTQS